MMPDAFHRATIPDWIRHAAERYGEREWVVLEGDRMSYAEAERRSNRLARELIAADVGKGTRVGLLLANGPDFVVAWLAASRVGALVVPICTYYQSTELAWTLRHADVHILLTAPTVAGHDLLDRLAADERVPVSREQLQEVFEAGQNNTGAATAQVDAFIQAVTSLAERHPEAATYQPGDIL